MTSPRSVLLVATAVLLCGGLVLMSSFAPPRPATAAPPDRPPPLPPPTEVQLRAAREAYRGFGGELHPPDGYLSGRRLSYHLWTGPRFDPDVVAKLPDLAFDYTLDVRIHLDTPPGTIAQLARLKNLRSLRILEDRYTWYRDERRPRGKRYRRGFGDHPELIREVAAIMQLEHLALRIDYGEGESLNFTDESAADMLRLPLLRSLEIEGKITDAGLEILSRHPGLESIKFGYCPEITDAGLAHLATMPQLRSLDISRCHKLTAKGLSPFAEVDRLRELKVSSSMERGLFDEVSRIGSLEWLNLNELGRREPMGADLALIAGLPRLRVLIFPSRTHVTEDGLRALSHASRLEVLGLVSGRGITDAGLKHLTRLRYLRFLYLHMADEVTDAAIEKLAAMPSLEFVYLSACPPLTDASLASLARKENLAGLLLRAPQMTGPAVRQFIAARGPKLLQLSLEAMPVDDDVVAFLAERAPKLQSLGLSRCQGVTDASLDALLKLRKLRVLDIEGTAMTAAAADRIREALPACRVRGR